jgi:hypothetical protein
MSKRVDLVSEIFGDILVLEFYQQENSHAKWKCLCMLCNKLIYVTASNLKTGNTKSCNSCSKIKHNNSQKRLYTRWSSLKRRDILCEEWKDSSEFMSDVESTFIEGYSLGRIDKTKTHSFNNSFWAKKRINTKDLSQRVYFSK